MGFHERLLFSRGVLHFLSQLRPKTDRTVCRRIQTNLNTDSLPSPQKVSGSYREYIGRSDRVKGVFHPLFFDGPLFGIPDFAYNLPHGKNSPVFLLRQSRKRVKSLVSNDFIYNELRWRRNQYICCPNQRVSIHRPELGATLEIVTFLNQYVIRTDAAKATLAVAVYSFTTKRLAHPKVDGVELSKSNVLMIGPHRHQPGPAGPKHCPSAGHSGCSPLRTPRP